MEADLILKDGLIVPVTSEIRRGDIVIKEGCIKEIDKNIDPSKYSGKVIELENKAVLPGLINAHTHLSMTLFRGIADELGLEEWLEKLRPLESEMNKDDIYAGALLGCLEMVKNGITTFSDMYFHMDKVAQAAKQIGLRADLGYGMVTIDKNQEGIDEELKKGIDFYNKFAENEDLIEPFMAPHSLSTCSTEFLRKISELDFERIQMHVAETRKEFEQIKKEYGKSPIKVLDDLGLLKKKFSAAHCVYLEKEDLEIIKKRKVKVIHNPNSNMKLASGIAPINEMNKNQITVALGTDGAASNNSLDVFQEMKNASLLQKVSNRNASALKAQQALKMATINGAKALNKEKKTGSIEEGKKADLIVIDLDSSSLNPLNDLISNLVYSATGEVVETVIIDGKVVVHENELQGMDEENILKKANDKINKIKRSL